MIYNNSLFGPTFGAGFDLIIFDCSNTNSNSYGNIGNTYGNPKYKFQ
jgi:hypothetical protein